MNKFKGLLERFKDPADKEVINENARLYDKFSALANFKESEQGKAMIDWLFSEITLVINKMIETKDVSLIYALESNFKLYTNLAEAKSQVEAIQAWLNSVEEQNE